MSTVAVVAPVAPGIGAGLITLGACLSFAFLYTFDKAFRALFAPLLLKVAAIGFGGVRGIGSVHPFGFLKAVVAHVEDWTHSGLAASERAIVWGCHTVMWSLELIAETVGSMAHNYAAAFDAVWHGITRDAPKVIRQTIVKPVQKAAVYSDAKLRATVTHLTHRIDALAARIAHTAVATVGVVAAPFPRIGRLEKTVKAQTKRLTKVEKALAVGASAVLTLTALKRLGLGWLKCNNVGKAGKAVCGMSPSVLESLLLDAALVSVAFNIEDFAKEMQTVTAEAARLIHNWAT